MTASQIDALRTWVQSQWPNVAVKLGIQRVASAPEWQPLSGDAGFRQYFRLLCDPSVLAVYAPPATEDGRAFLAVAKVLGAAGVLTPRIWACDLHEGFFLVEDLGKTLVLEKLNADSADEIYGRAMASLQQLQRAPADPVIFPHYDQERLREELELFPKWFCQTLLGFRLDEDHKVMLDNTFALLERYALDQPQVLVHRDFHSRNLVYRDSGQFGVIDFQDAVVGPITYDLVSLLRDCYIAWPETQVHTWLKDYYERLRNHGDLPGVSLPQFTHWFDWMGLQRHIKVLGIFARLSLRDGKHGYLEDLPLVLHYVRSVAQGYDILSPFTDWLDQSLMPLIREQSWYKANK